jgi:hypothetical protein
MICAFAAAGAAAGVAGGDAGFDASDVFCALWVLQAVASATPRTIGKQGWILIIGTSQLSMDTARHVAHQRPGVAPRLKR